MHLNYKSQGSGPAILLLHGLFGSLTNLAKLADDLQHNHTTIQVDLRNHGQSPRSLQMNYPLMAKDVLELLDRLDLPQATLVGHSMGGKVAMSLSQIAADRIAQIVILDIAPVSYPLEEHNLIFKALQEVSLGNVTERAAAAAILHRYIHHPQISQFLLKSFDRGKWFFDVEAIVNNYHYIAGWREATPWDGRALFICGAKSGYVPLIYHPAIYRQFPMAQVTTVDDAGHWLHYEKSAAVLQCIRKALLHVL